MPDESGAARLHIGLIDNLNARLPRHTPIACDGFITLGLWLSVSIRSRLSSLTSHLRYVNVGSFGKISIVCISLASQDFKVKVVQLAVKNCIADAAVINVGIVLVNTLYRRIVKADNSGIIRKFTVGNNGLDCLP